MLIDHPTGNYRFLKGHRPYSSAVIARAGFEIVHVTLGAPLPFASGFEWMVRHLAGLGRPPQAVCAMELRSPRPFSFEGFAEFNDVYLNVLAKADMLVDGLNPVARTNVAPEHGPPAEPCLYAFSYTAPHAASGAGPTFVVAGAGELRDGRLEPQAVVRAGETSAEALREKAAFVLRCMAERLQGLGVGWDQVSATNVYTAHDVFALFQAEILPAMGAAGRHGLRWHYARPPILGLEFEMDVRGLRTGLHLPAA